jgi:hypothetical protein
MTQRDPSRPFDARLEGRGHQAAGNQGGQASPVAGDSPTEGTVEGPLAPQPMPSRSETELPSEMRPTERDTRKSDGVVEFRKLEDRTKTGRE